MKLEDIKALTPAQARLLYRQFSEDMYAAGWMGDHLDHAPFEDFVLWLEETKDEAPDSISDLPDYEAEFMKSWDKWRKK